MSLNSPFLLSPFFFLSFFFYLRKCLSRRTEACNKIHSLIYYWWNRIFSVSLFLFWIHITFQYLGRVEGKQFKLYLSLTMFRILSLFFTGGWHPRSWLVAVRFSADFCPKTLFYSFYRRLSPELVINRRLSPTTSVPKLKILFQISLTKKMAFWC